MLENIKLFATDNDRSTYEEGDNYTEPYVSLVDGIDNVNYDKLIIGTIDNPSIGTVNVQNGDYFNRISVSKKIYIGGGVNFLCFPFDITINDLRQALGNYKLSNIYLGQDIELSIQVTSNNMTWNQETGLTLTERKYNQNTVIPSGCPIFICINSGQSSEAVTFTFTFKNKTISIGNSLTSVQCKTTTWYFVGSPFKNSVGTTGLSTCSRVLGVSNGQIIKTTNLQATSGTCSAWLEYRGPIPSE